VDLALLVALDDSCERGGQPGVGIDTVDFSGLDQRGDDGPILGSGVMAREESVLAVQGDGADRAFDGVVIGHVVFGASRTTGYFDRVMVGLLRRDRGVGVRRSGQAELTLSCELALLSGRPCDYPVCAASAYP
jgi:hypothetical protein